MKSPEGRFGHSCHLYRDFILVFGGSSLYNMEIKKREVYDDVILYDLNYDRWIDPLHKHRDHESITQYSLNNVNEIHFDDHSLAPFQVMPPLRRYGHASAVLGCALFIHGGISGEDNNVIVESVKHPNEEFALFDLQARYWIRVQQEDLINEDTGERTLIHTTLNSLAYHTMTPIFEPSISRT